MLGTGCGRYREVPRSPSCRRQRCGGVCPCRQSSSSCCGTYQHQVLVIRASSRTQWPLPQPQATGALQGKFTGEQRRRCKKYLSPLLSKEPSAFAAMRRDVHAVTPPLTHTAHNQSVGVWGGGGEGLTSWERGRKEEREGTRATWEPGGALTLPPRAGLPGRCPSETGSASRAMLRAAQGYARGRQLETTGYCLREGIYYRAPCKAQIRLSRRREKTLGVCYMYAELVISSNAVQ